MPLTYDQLDVLIARYDAFLIDQFGVLIDGVKAYPGAVNALAQIAELGKPVAILSNSGKRAQPNCDRVTSHGFDRSHFLNVVTSGEIAYHTIADALGTTLMPDTKVMTLARQGDASPIADLGLTETNDPAAATLLLIVSRDIRKTRADYAALLSAFHTTGGRCLCLNPDLNMLTPAGLQFSAGTIAKMYEDGGGTVEWYGKPHPEIYDAALRLFVDIPKNRVLCIGDSMHHDILGGNAADLATALVRDGVHAHLSDGELKAELLAQGIEPDHFIRSFSVA